MFGKVIYSAKVNNIKTVIDLSSEAKGIYFLKLYNENFSNGIKKIIIQ